MVDPLTGGGWLIVDERCVVRLGRAARPEHVTFVFDGGATEFEISFAPGILRRMLELSGN
ncbi:hypothetical protein [Nocardia asteroides]|uniref:hypothetical protein n=1 Tax=Nocardia asteroides TaxID=1824 RepID=UPI001E2D4A61|nr:hypothetical protein [Nocardia asteroides]UGT64693.1 hypothetical protein LTT61_16055 [Nocardia asteroides]